MQLKFDFIRKIGYNKSSRRYKMNKEIIFVVEESMDGGYEAKALGYSIFTQAETLQELKNEIKDAVNCHFVKKNRQFLSIQL